MRPFPLTSVACICRMTASMVYALLQPCRAQHTGEHSTQESTAHRRAQHTGEHSTQESTAHRRAQHTGEHSTQESTAHRRAQHTGEHSTQESTAHRRAQHTGGKQGCSHRWQWQCTTQHTGGYNSTACVLQVLTTPNLWPSRSRFKMQKKRRSSKLQ